MVHNRPASETITAKAMSTISFILLITLSPKAILASGNHNVLVVLFGYSTGTTLKDLITVIRSCVYDSSSKVARVATGSLFPMMLENFDE